MASPAESEVLHHPQGATMYSLLYSLQVAALLGLIASAGFDEARMAVSSVASTSFAPCPPTYTRYVPLVHRPDNINSVLLDLKPNHTLTAPGSTYFSRGSDPFQYAGEAGWFIYYNAHYAAKCYEFNGVPAVVGDYMISGTFTSLGSGGGTGGGSGDDENCETQVVLDPACEPASGGGSSGGEGPGGSTCTMQYVYIDIYNNETERWEVWWEGYAYVCE